MQVDRHVFGSVQGYTTLARSPGVTDADCRILEATSFGSTYDAAYRPTLTKSGAFLSRPLAGSRRAITRVEPGKPDDEGRPTLLFVTLVIQAADWDGELERDARPLLKARKLWDWDGKSALSVIDLAPAAPPRLATSGQSFERLLGLVSLVELSWNAGTPVVVSENDYSLEDLASVERVLPAEARGRYSAGYRSLNPALPVTLNLVAAGVAGGDRVRRLVGAKSPYAMHLAENGIGDPLVSLPYQGFGQPKVEFGVAEADAPRAGTSGASRPTAAGLRPSVRSGGLGILTIVAATLALVFGALAGWTARQVTLPEPAQPPAWDGVLLEAVSAAAPLAKDRQQALDRVESLLNQPEFSESESRSQVLAAIETQRKQARAAATVIKQAIDATSSIPAGDEKQHREAVQRIDSAGQAMDPAVQQALKEWGHDRLKVRRENGLLLEELRAMVENAPRKQLNEMRGFMYMCDQLQSALSDSSGIVPSDATSGIEDLIAVAEDEQLERAEDASRRAEAEHRQASIATQGQEVERLLGLFKAIENLNLQPPPFKDLESAIAAYGAEANNARERVRLVWQSYLVWHKKVIMALESLDGAIDQLKDKDNKKNREELWQELVDLSNEVRDRLNDKPSVDAGAIP